MTAPKHTEPDLSGQTIDRYELVRRLGMGGMGAVYEAEHLRLRKRFAIKLLRAELAQNELFRKRFLREARAASVISHPHVVSISDFGDTPEGHVYFVMELLEGLDLHELLAAVHKLPWGRSRGILIQVTSALHAAHLKGVIHRDIKPSNCFLANVPGQEADDFVKVLDFGIAKLSGSIGDETANLTSTDEIFGTVAYIAPEMVTGTTDDRRSDIYSVGVMMYRMLTGELPFKDGNAYQILSHHVHTTPIAPRIKESSIPEPAEEIILKALAKNPEERFATMDELGQAIRRGSLKATKVIVGLPLPASSARSVDQESPAPSRWIPIGLQPVTAPSGPSDASTAPLGSTSVTTVPQGSTAVESSDTAAAHPLAEGSDTAAAHPPAEDSDVAMAHRAAEGSDATTTRRSEPLETVRDPSPPDPTAPSVSPPTVPSLSRPTVPSLSRPTAPSVSRPTVPPVSTLPSASTIRVLPPEEQERPRSNRTVPVLAVVALALGLTVFVLASPDDDTDPRTLEASASPPPTEAIGQPSPSPNADREVDHIVPPTDPAPSEPEPPPSIESNETPREPSEPLSKTEPPPVDPTPERGETEQLAQPQPSSPPKAASKPKPKPDAQVVAALEKKILAKCKVKGDTLVKVEGQIASTGRVVGLFTTPPPPNPLGACAQKLVEAARFDPTPGGRAMKKVSVKL